MKIISWNCNMAFRKKAHLVTNLKPDILVLPECEQPENMLAHTNLNHPSSLLWFGKNPHKGLAIIAYNGYQLSVHDCHNTAFQHIIPLKVTKINVSLNLFAIWANNPSDKDGRYVEQVWKAVHYYEKLLEGNDCILTGDFNSNSIWDKEHKEKSHSAMVAYLQDMDIHSCYHQYFKQLQGSEQDPSFYFYRHKEKTYHLDYCFASGPLLKKLKKMQVGTFEEWSPYSDHVPLMMEFRDDIKYVRK
jgi:exodeoxyribonuclease III